MTLNLTDEERVARARADLRIGAPIALISSSGGAIALAAETLSRGRLADLRTISSDLDLAVSHRRAETLRARAYDGDVARIALPKDADLRWVRATADPSLDLENPLRGPYRTRREGAADLHRLAIAMCKQARLLPAALVLPVSAEEAHAYARDANLSLLDEMLVSVDDFDIICIPFLKAKAETPRPIYRYSPLAFAVAF